MPFDDDTLSVSSHTLIEQLTFGCVNWKDRKKCTSAAVLMSGLLSFLRSWDQSQWVRNRTWSGMWKWRRLKIHRNNSQKCDSIIVCFKNTLRTHFRFSSPAEWRRRTVKMENHLNALSPSRSPLRFLSLGFWLLFLYLFKLVNGGRFPIAPPFGFIYDFRFESIECYGYHLCCVCSQYRSAHSRFRILVTYKDAIYRLKCWPKICLDECCLAFRCICCYSLIHFKYLKR